MCKIRIFKLLIKKGYSHIWYNWVRKQISSFSFHSWKLKSSTLSKLGTGYLIPDQEGENLPSHINPTQPEFWRPKKYAESFWITFVPEPTWIIIFSYSTKALCHRMAYRDSVLLFFALIHFVDIEMVRDAFLASGLGQKVPKTKFGVKYLRDPTTRRAYPHHKGCPSWWG